MAKYVLKFSKEGYFKYTSHLDLLRFFKRSFKRIGMKLVYSQGFNPHPKMGFAQPLSLGYSSIGELLEFETVESFSPEEIMERMSVIMPEGLKLLGCVLYEEEGKTLAALTEAAEYIIGIPFQDGMPQSKTCEELCQQFLEQEHIFVKKKKKKSKELVDIDIKDKIRFLLLTNVNENILLTTTLDAGSESNLSPELLIDGFLQFIGANIAKQDIEVMRKKLFFTNKFNI